MSAGVVNYPVQLLNNKWIKNEIKLNVSWTILEDFLNICYSGGLSGMINFTQNITELMYIETLSQLGPVGFEPTTASAPGQYLDDMYWTEMLSYQQRWYPWPS